MAVIKRFLSILLIFTVLLFTGCANHAKTSELPQVPEQLELPFLSDTPQTLPAEKQIAPPPDEELPASLPPEQIQPAQPELPLSGRVICVDPGHCVVPVGSMGRKEPISPLRSETKIAFATGTAGKNLSEEQLNLQVGLKLRDTLQALGAEVVMTREVSEIAITNVDRCTIAVQGGAEVCVRIHADGANDASAQGVSVQIPFGELLGTPSISDESAHLGELMVASVVQETGAKNRGTNQRSDLTGFNFAQIPTVLIEMGFMTNPDEDALLESDAYQTKIITGIVNALFQWYGIEE